MKSYSPLSLLRMINPSHSVSPPQWTWQICLFACTDEALLVRILVIHKKVNLVLESVKDRIRDYFHGTIKKLANITFVPQVPHEAPPPPKRLMLA